MDSPISICVLTLAMLLPLTKGPFEHIAIGIGVNSFTLLHAIDKESMQFTPVFVVARAMALLHSMLISAFKYVTPCCCVLAFSMLDVVLNHALILVSILIAHHALSIQLIVDILTLAYLLTIFVQDMSRTLPFAILKATFQYSSIWHLDLALSCQPAVVEVARLDDTSLGYCKHTLAVL